MMCLSKAGDEYKNFILLSVDDLKDFNATGYYLRHKTTGLEVYHVLKNDEENLFSFNFRTLAKNSKGAAHIMEHSVLCGSEKFPLKEPFTTLDNQSVKTFLNAMTYPDKTCYPASSLIESDYFNLMDVYADAVFFPILSRQTFMQEGYRLEIDEKDKVSIQGVVYNEMKGNYSSFSQVAINHLIDTMYPDSVYCYESGGDPLEIPSLTYEQWLDFHKKFYKPSNCLLFLYGNIPTQKQLDFLDEKYINRLEKAYGIVKNPDITSKLPFISEDIKELQKFSKIDGATYADYIAPDNGATGDVVCQAWYYGKSDIEKAFICEILIGNDSSPLSKRLIDSELGDDISIACGNYGYVKNNGFISFGLGGVKEGNEYKVYDLIQKSIKEILENGIEKKDIDSAVMGFDFTLREVSRHFGPFSLNIMAKAVSSWTNGSEPDSELFPISDFEKLKQKIAANPDYIKQVIQKIFVENKDCAYVKVSPSKLFFEQRNEKEKALISLLESSSDKEKIKQNLQLLHAYQEKQETEEELSCIPHLKVSELSTDLNHVKTEFSYISASERKIPFVLSKEDTNGIVYIDAAFPIDNLNPEDFIDLPLMVDTLTDLGWNDKAWDECTSQMAAIMGDVGAKTIIGELSDSPFTKESVKLYEDKNIPGRNWLCLTGKFLVEKSEECLTLFSEIISKMSFKDEKRLQTLLAECKTDKKNDFIRSGHHYIALRGRSLFTKASCISEIFYGITQFFHILSLKKSDCKQLLSKYERIYKNILDQGCIIHVTTDEKSVDVVKKLLPDFVTKTDLKPLSAPGKTTIEDFLPYVYKIPQKNENEVIKVKTQAGFAASYFPCSIWLTREASAEDILSTWLNGHQLWEKIRMKGGAYGSSCAPDAMDKIFGMISWRDPNPSKSLELFIEALEDVCKKQFTKEEVDCCIISNYSDEIMPESPYQRGIRGFNRFLYGTTPEMIQKRVEDALKVTPEDVHLACERILKNAKESSRKLLICDNSEEIYGNVVKIPL